MAITYSSATTSSPGGTWTDGNISSASTAVTTGQLIVVIWANGYNQASAVGTLTISNTGSVGAGLTGTLIGQNSSPAIGTPVRPST